MPDTFAVSTELQKQLRLALSTLTTNVQLLTTAGAELGARLNDGRFVITKDGTTNPVVLTITVTGSDTELGSLPATVTGMKLYSVTTAGTSLLDLAYQTSKIFNNTGDSLVETLTINLPTV